MSDLFTGPASRTSDPATSKAAAASVSNLRASQARVLAIFRAYGNLTDEELLNYLHDTERQLGVKLMSPSGARSRRSELSKANMERLNEIAAEYSDDDFGSRNFETLVAVLRDKCRDRLRTEGFRAPLWDTGERRRISTGRMATVWGIAK